MISIPVKLPALVEVPDIGESESEWYMAWVVDFLSNYTGKKIKTEFHGYLDNRAVIAFYTNASDPVLKKELKKLRAEQKIEQEKEDSPCCPECGKKW